MLVDRKAVLIELFIQAILFGLYLASLVHYLRWLVFADEGWKYREKINRPILVVAILLFALTTIAFAIMVKWELFYIWNDATDYYQSPVERLVVIMNVFIIVLIVDAVLVYRCWEVYARSWRVVFLPIVFWFASLVLSIEATYDDYVAYTALRGKFSWPCPRKVTIALVIFYLCSITTDAYATCAIVYRILSAAQASSHSRQPLRKIAHIIAESGMLYTAVTAVYVVGLFQKENSGGHGFQRAFAAMNVAMAGIAFHLVVIRTSQNRVNWAQNVNKQNPPLASLSRVLHTTTPDGNSSIDAANDLSVVQGVSQNEPVGGATYGTYRVSSSGINIYPSFSHSHASPIATSQKYFLR